MRPISRFYYGSRTINKRALSYFVPWSASFLDPIGHFVDLFAYAVRTAHTLRLKIRMIPVHQFRNVEIAVRHQPDE
jgi:hypothetical protein